MGGSPRGRIKPFVEKTEVVRSIVRIDASDDVGYLMCTDYQQRRPRSEMNAAPQAGQSYMKRGKTVLLDGDAIAGTEVFEDCAAQG